MLRLMLCCLVGLTLAAGCHPRWEGPTTDHFDGKRFSNLPPVEQPRFRDLLKWRRTKDPGHWPEFVNAEPGPMPPALVQCDDLRVTFINHSTVLVQTAGINLLTDPIWSERASPLKRLGPRRHRPPGIRFESLPPIDVVVVSHNHYDHMDVPTLRRLAEEHAPDILVGLGNADWLERKGVAGATDLDWWQTREVAEGISVTGVPAQHWSLRGLADRDRTLWLGFVIDTPCGKTYFAGDTGFGPHFAEIRERLGAVRLALLPIGAYRPRWFMQTSHIDPAQAVQAHRALEAGTSIGVHFGTFALGDDGRVEPLIELDRVMPADVRPQFWVLDEGESRLVPAGPRDQPTGD